MSVLLAYHKYFRIPKTGMHVLGLPVILGYFDLVRNSIFYYFVSKGWPQTMLLIHTQWIQ